MNKKGIGKGIKGIAALCLLLGIALPFFTGCSGQNATGKRQLWVVTEKSTWSRMNGQLHALEQAYEKEHTDVDIRVEFLPTQQQERDVYLQQLRTEILQGGGPDCYLLPTDNALILDEPTPYTYVEAEPLFSDVDLAMGNGLFYDIAKFYDKDDTLGKESLNSSVMAAGVVDGKRYVLPLRYDLPVIYARQDALVEAGIDPAVLEEDILTIMEAILESGDAVLAAGALCDSFSAFSDFVDYKTGNVLIEEAALVRYMEAYQDLVALAGSQDTVALSKLDISTYISDSYNRIIMSVENAEDIKIVDGEIIYENAKEKFYTYYPLWIGNMQDALAYGPVNQHGNMDMIIRPVRAVGGDVVATVTYYGAVGSGCEDPALAYDFLRQFLLETSQWEENRPVRNHLKPLKGQGDTSNDLQYPGLIENGWAVRDENSLQPLWVVRRKQVYKKPQYMSTDAARQRMREIGLMELEEGRLPILGLEMDQVRFNTTLSDELADILAGLNVNDPTNAGAPTQADIPALAEKLIWTVRWFVSEG